MSTQLISSSWISELQFAHSVSPSFELVVAGIMQALCSLAVQNQVFFTYFVSRNMQMLCWVGQHENWPVLQIALVKLLWFCAALIIISIVTFVFIFSSNKSSAESFHFGKVIFERH